MQKSVDGKETVGALLLPLALAPSPPLSLRILPLDQRADAWTHARSPHLRVHVDALGLAQAGARRASPGRPEQPRARPDDLLPQAEERQKDQLAPLALQRARAAPQPGRRLPSRRRHQAGQAQHLLPVGGLPPRQAPRRRCRRDPCASARAGSPCAGGSGKPDHLNLGSSRRPCSAEAARSSSSASSSSSSSFPVPR